MTRKDFAIIAKIVALCNGAPESAKYDINHLLREQNINFDSTRFWSAVDKEMEQS